MDTVFATPIRPVSSQENADATTAAKSGQVKSLTGHKSLKASSNTVQDAAFRKKMMMQQQFTSNTPSNSARRKLGNVSNTPIASSGGIFGSLKPQRNKGLGAHHKEESFVKSLDFGGAEKGGDLKHKKKSALSILNEEIEAYRAALPTVPEEIENYYPLTKKELREERDPTVKFAIFDETVLHLAVHSDDDDESQKENRLMTVDELCELI